MAQNFDALFPDSVQGARAAALETALDPHEWPLTFSLADAMDDDLAAAAQRLPSADQVTALDLLWRNQLARDLQDKLDRKQMAVEDWPERIEENTRALLADVAASGITTWPEWHRNAVSRAISVPLVLAEKVGLDNQLAEALASTRHEIAGELGEVAEVQVVRNMILGMTDDM